MHYMLRRFCNFDRMALPATVSCMWGIGVHSWCLQLLNGWRYQPILVCYICPFSLCAHCMIETTHFVNAGCRNSQFFRAVGYGCRLLALSGACFGSWVPVFFVLRSLLPYMCEERLFSYVPQLLQVRRSMSLSCYRSAVVVRMTVLSLFCVCLLPVTDSWLWVSTASIHKVSSFNHAVRTQWKRTNITHQYRLVTPSDQK